MLRAIFTVRLLDDGNNRYQPDGGWHRRGKGGNAGVMILVLKSLRRFSKIEQGNQRDGFICSEIQKTLSLAGKIKM